MVALFSAMFMVFIGCGGSHSSPEKAAVQLIELMVDNKASEIMKEVRKADGTTFSGDEYEFMSAKMSWKIMGLEMDDEVASIKANNIEYNTDKTAAEVFVRLDYKNGQADIVPVNVHAFDGKWYVVLYLPELNF